MERRTVTLEGDRGVVGFLQLPAFVSLPSVLVWNNRAFFLSDGDEALYSEVDCYHCAGDAFTSTAPNGERGDAPKFESIEGGAKRVTCPDCGGRCRREDMLLCRACFGEGTVTPTRAEERGRSTL